MQNFKSSRTQITFEPKKAAHKLQRFALVALFLGLGSAAAPVFATSAPSAPNMTDASDSGSSSTDNITNVKQPVFTGTGTALSYVQLYSGTTLIGAGVTNPYGQWQMVSNVKLEDGKYSIVAKQTVGGVVSAASSPLNITIDTLAPTTTLPDLLPGSDSGTYNNDNITKDSTPYFQGIGTPGTTVYLYNSAASNSSPVGSGKVSPQGVWTAMATLSSGANTFKMSARTVDVAGNSSALMSSLNIIVDTVAPAIPTAIPDLVASSDSGFSQTDNITKVTLPTFTAKAEPDAKVEIYGLAANKILIGTGIADSSGIASITANQPISGNYDVYSKVFDRAGNEAAEISPHFLVSIVTAPPTTPEAPYLFSASDSGVLGDNITKVKNPVIGATFGNGLGDGDLTITYFAGVFTYTAKAKVGFKQYSWSVTSPELPTGVYDVVVKNTDAAGNESVAPTYKLTIDDYAPSVTINTPVQGAILKAFPTMSGTASDFTSGVKNVDLTVKRLSDSKYWNGSVWVDNSTPLTADLSGKDWTKNSGWPTGNFLTNDAFEITARSYDKAGNVSDTAVRNFSVDLDAPIANIATPTQNQSVSIASFNAITGGVMDNVGVTEVSIKLFRTRNGVTTFWNGTSFETAQTLIPVNVSLPGATSSAWDYTVPADLKLALDAGDYFLTAYGKDAAGNVSPAVGRSFNIINDTAAPVSIILNPAQNQTLPIASFNSINGNSSDNVGVTQVFIKLFRTRNGVTTFWNGTSFGAAQVQLPAVVANPGAATSAWSFTVSPALKAALDGGAYFLAAYGKDAQGNLSGAVGRNFNLTASSATIQAPRSFSGNQF